MPSRLPTETYADSLSAHLEPWASIDEAAAHLGVRKDSVYRWIESRGLPARKIGKLWKLKLSEIDAWVNASHVPGEGESEDDDVPSAASTPKARNGRAAREHVVLVVDDDQLVRETLGDFLSDEGYRVLLATSGAHALKLLARSPVRPSVILLDLKMPELDGWQFRELQLKEPELAGIPVIVLTGTPSATVREASIVLRKPLRLPVIGKAIANVLDSEVAR
jgi:excisionase family DNA binding protein